MSKGNWQGFVADCESCGDECVVFTTTGEHNSAFDGDAVRCVGCGMPGSVCVDDCGPVDGEDRAHAHVAWHDDPDCECDWCKRQDQAATIEQLRRDDDCGAGPAGCRNMQRQCRSCQSQIKDAEIERLEGLLAEVMAAIPPSTWHMLSDDLRRRWNNHASEAALRGASSKEETEPSPPSPPPIEIWGDGEVKYQPGKGTTW